MDPQLTLHNHFAICEDAYQLLSEENHLLKPNGQGLSEQFIEKKQLLLQRLEDSLIALQQIDKATFNKAENIDIIDRSQKKLMQIFLLDRENERLLSARANPSKARNAPLLMPEPKPKKSEAPPSPPTTRIHKIYGENSL